MSNTYRTLGVLAAIGLLSACGATPLERAATGAPIGAAIALATEGDAVEGAIYGAAAGAVVCSVTPGAPGCY